MLEHLEPNSVFGQYSDKILQLANETFSVLHYKFLKEIWGDNKTTAKLHHNQCFTDWRKGVYEVFIPTHDNVEHNLGYYRIAIKVLPEISQEAKLTEVQSLSNLIKQPLGIVESELLVLIAPRQNKWGLVRGFKHANKPGYFTAVFVNKSPEIIWKRVMAHILNFISKRLDGLMRALGFETWVWKWILSKRNSYCSTIRIVEQFSYVIRQSFETLVLLHQHFRDKLQAILSEIGMQNVALAVLKPLKELKNDELARVFTIVRERLAIELMPKEDKGLYHLEVLKAIPNG
jgi:hypothetical protein